MRFSYTEQTKEVWKRLLAFMQACLGEGAGETEHKSWGWSRVISDGHNRGLASKDNRGLTSDETRQTIDRREQQIDEIDFRRDSIDESNKFHVIYKVIRRKIKGETCVVALIRMPPLD